MLDGNCSRCILRDPATFCLHFEREIDNDLKELCASNKKDPFDHYWSKFLAGQSALDDLQQIRSLLLHSPSATDIIGSKATRLVVAEYADLMEARVTKLKDDVTEFERRLNAVKGTLERGKDEAAWKENKQACGYYNGLVFAIALLEGRNPTEDFFSAADVEEEQAPGKVQPQAIAARPIELNITIKPEGVDIKVKDLDEGEKETKLLG